MLLVLLLCASLPPGVLADAAPRGVPRFDHVVVLVMENKDYGEIVENRDEAPYFNELADRYALVRHFHAIHHPSLPNYLAMLGGSTFGIDSDCTSCHVAAYNLVDQLERHSLTWKAYLEDIRFPCYNGATSGAYAKRHNPFMYFDSIRSDEGRCHKIVGFKQMQRDLSDNALPQFAFVTPNVCHDTHDCSISTGDEFLSRRVPPILRHLGSNGVLILTYDEGHTTAGCCGGKAKGGHIATVVAGPGARPHARSWGPYDTYSMLKTIEQGFGLHSLRGARCECTRSLDPFLKG